MSETILILSPGNHSLESELISENVRLFSMFVYPGSSLKAVITCGPNARFEFRNISTVTLSGLEFVGCFENHVITIGLFRLENSVFFGSYNYGQAMVNGTVTVLSIEESTAELDRVVLIILSAANEPPITLTELLYYYNCSILDEILSATDTIVNSLRVIGISSKSTNISITHSRFEGNNVGPIGALIYNKLDSRIYKIILLLPGFARYQ